jgi:uncharacterized membrane protein
MRPDSASSNPEESDLQTQIAELRHRVMRLEEALIAQSQSTPGARAGEGSNGSTGTSAMAVEPSLESRIGSQWLNRAGILAVLVGVALFLKLAIDNHWLGPAARVSVGLAGGIALYLLSEVFRRRNYTGFSFSLKGIGSGVFYLTLWAAFTLLHLLSAPLVAAGMLVVTALNGLLAWRQNSRVLACYALLGSLLTPLLVADHRNHEVALFAYLLMMAAGAAILALLRGWHALLLTAFVGTTLYGIFWAWTYYRAAEFTVTLAFGALAFALFSGLPMLLAGHTERGTSLTALSCLNALAGIVMAAELFTGWPRVMVILLLAAFYFAWARTHFGREADPLPAWVTDMNANVALLAAVSFAIHRLWHSAVSVQGMHTGEQLSYSFWFMGFGAMLVAVGFRRRTTALRWQGLVLLFLSIAKVFLFDIRLLSETSRVFSFLGLGWLLLVVSFVYQRDWLKLRSS